MKINLVEKEIHEALRQYIEGEGISLTGKNVEVNLTAGRGGTGHKAQVEITNAPAEPAAETEDDSSSSQEEQQAIKFGE